MAADCPGPAATMKSWLDSKYLASAHARQQHLKRTGAKPQLAPVSSAAGPYFTLLYMVAQPP